MDIQKAMRLYQSDIAIGHSPTTCETYDQGLRRFKEYLETQEIYPTDRITRLTVSHAINFARWLGSGRDGKAPLSKDALCVYMSTVSSFIAFLTRERMISPKTWDLERMHDTFRDYRRGNHRRLPKLPPGDSVDRLIRAARAVKVPKRLPRLEMARRRDIAILESLRSSGMRVAELTGLKIGDVDAATHSARVTGKGDKERNVFFDATAWTAIQNYLKMRGELSNDAPLFARHDRRISNRVGPLTTDAVRWVFHTLAREANIEFAMTPHSLRHAFATKVLEVSGDLAATQDLLGHSSPATTRIYAQVSIQRLQAVHQAVFGAAAGD